MTTQIVGKTDYYVSSSNKKADYTWYVRDASGNVMALYERGGQFVDTTKLYATEFSLYGSSRLGVMNRRVNVDTVINSVGPSGGGMVWGVERGNKFFELANHLGNVLATVSDKKRAVQNGTTGIVSHFVAEVVTAQDYYSFGMMMPGRKFNINKIKFRYGFNGKEDDNDAGEGIQDYGMRIYDARLGRFLSVDALTDAYPWYTPYQFAGNIPILYIDLDGLEPAALKPLRLSAALEIVKNYETRASKRAFSNITKAQIVNSLKTHLLNPQKSVIAVNSGLFCSFYAFTYAMTYYNADLFTNGFLAIIENGEYEYNGIKITASDALKEYNGENLAPFIFAAAVREHYNKFLNFGDGKYWSSTSSGDLKKFLTEVGGMVVSEFSYGHEYIGDGITNDDLGTLFKHLKNKDIAILRVDAQQFNASDKSASGAESIFSGGDHYVVLTDIISYDKECSSITFTYYDSHGSDTRTMNLSQFRDATYQVLLLQNGPRKQEPLQGPSSKPTEKKTN
jgi:RHS repeat-associated protein